MALFGGGAVLAGLVLGSIATFVIDRQFVRAVIASVIGAALSFVGLIHGEKVEFNAAGGPNHRVSDHGAGSSVSSRCGSDADVTRGAGPTGRRAGGGRRHRRATLT